MENNMKKKPAGQKIMLKATYHLVSESIYGGRGGARFEERTVEARIGAFPILTTLTVMSVKQDCITMKFEGKTYELRPGGTLHFHDECKTSPYDVSHCVVTVTW